MTTITKITLATATTLAFLSCADNAGNGSLSVKDTMRQMSKAYSDSAQSEKHNISQLTGTTVLDASEKNMNSGLMHGLWLQEISSTECLQSSSETPPPTGITSIKQLDDSTLIVSADVFENCSYNFLGEIEVVANNTINIIYHGYGGYASCSCCFGLTYKIELRKGEDYKFNNFKYVTINGADKTPIPRIR